MCSERAWRTRVLLLHPSYGFCPHGCRMAPVPPAITPVLQAGRRTKGYKQKGRMTCQQALLSQLPLPPMVRTESQGHPWLEGGRWLVRVESARHHWLPGLVALAGIQNSIESWLWAHLSFLANGNATDIPQYVCSLLV